MDVSIAPLVPTPKPEPVYGLPVRLMIPKLDVDAAVKYMGVTKTGDMAVPDNIADVGWYKHGPHPGNKGSAVIAGHVLGLRGEPGVFSSLSKLVAGDGFSTVDSLGQTASFVIQRSQLYGPDDPATEVFESTAGSHLNLITCTGEWDKNQRRYLKRLVVFADLVKE